MPTAAARPPVPPPFRSFSSYKISPHIHSKLRVRFGKPSAPSSDSKKVDMPVEFLPNARRRKIDPTWRGGGFSLGVDLGSSRTGLALGKGYTPRPLAVLELSGQKLELRLLEIAEKAEVDEFIVGIPKSYDGKETVQSNKVRSIAGRFAAKASERGLKKSTRRGKVDAYSAMMVLERYFSISGLGTELVLPKQLELQERLRRGPYRDLDF
ncbi:putative pre-16S rRNA nuclease isoform X5 [Zingiber officinale]|uniref:putative pre-16S rRNA nuclease isoform X5 n=1 Tax=Zingiber officinale TaxID=94328 RepID=UPI001C4C55A4|nr:putative pre-16S rRNA nuclease isoform X5 [Zingiber officinale]